MAVSKPPPGRLISPTHPLARGLVVAFAGNQQAGASVDNLAPTRSQLRGAGTALAWVGSKYGGAVKLNGSSSIIDYGPSALLRGGGAFTVAFRFKANTLTLGNYPTIYSVGYTGSNSGLYIGFNGRNTGVGVLDVFSNVNPQAGAETSKNFASFVGQWFDVVCAYDGSGSPGCLIEVNQVADYTTFGSAARSNTGTRTKIGSIDGLGRYFDGEIDYLLHWEGRFLNASERRSVAANPWQLWPDEPQLVFAPASGVTGTSSATLTTTGTATGAVAVAAASSQTLPLTGTSTGAVAVAGASAGTIPLTGSAAGAVAVAGASSQAVSLAGTATGAAAVAGASSGTVDLTGTATGTIPPLAVSGDSAVTVDLAGTATGAVAVAGASSGTITTTGTAAATNPVAGASSATLALTGSAAGAVDVAGASAVTISTTGSATGEVQNFAAVSDGTFTLAGTATGTVEVAGASAQQIELGGAAAFTIRNILGSSAGRVQTSASRTEALNSADRQNTFNPARIAAGSGKRGSNVQTGKR